MIILSSPADRRYKDQLAQEKPEPHELWALGSKDPDEDVPEAANTESSLLTFSDAHFGQVTFDSLLATSSSNLWSHSEHLYSNRGIVFSLHFTYQASP